MDAGKALVGSSTLTYQYIRPPGRISTFAADLITAGEDLIALEMTLDRGEPLILQDEEVIGDGYRSIWFLVQGAGWDIAAVYRPDGHFTGYYVDVLDPVSWQDADPATLLPVVDLFLDVWIWPDGRYQVLDEDEFAVAIDKGWLTDRQRDHALRVLTDIRERIDLGTFPPPDIRQIAEQ